MMQLVLMVLQGLMFLVDPWEAAGGEQQLLEQSLMVGLKEGESGKDISSSVWLSFFKI